MNNIDSMPPKCYDCPYWEICEEPYICPTRGEKRTYLKSMISHNIDLLRK